ncbi:12555_t:CDS:2, partial [Racocetra fulgida]
KLERLGNRKVHSIQDEAVIKKLFLAQHAFEEKFRRDEISGVTIGMVDEKEVIIVHLNLPNGSLLHFDLPSLFEGFPVIIDYGLVEPFNQNYHERLMPGISIGQLKNLPNACTLGILAETKSIPGGVFILTTKHGLGKKGTPVVQPGKLDHYSSLSTDVDGRLLDYAFCRISNNNRVSSIVNSFKTSISNDPNNVIDVKKVGRSTFYTKGKMVDVWKEITSSVFDPPRKVYALYVAGNNGAFGAPGDSGSPVFDNSNKLVGILHGGFNDGSAYVIPIHLIFEHCKKNSAQFELL